MKNLTIPIFIFISIISIFSEISIAEEVEGGENSDGIQSLTMECVYKVSTNYDIPMPLLVSVLKVEGGVIGTNFLNLNGTTDLGPALINSTWLPKIKKFGVTKEQLQNNGCINVMVLGWILAGYVEQDDESIWQAVGRLHSKNKQHQLAYSKKVFEVFQELSTKTKYSGAKNIVSMANNIDEFSRR